MDTIDRFFREAGNWFIEHDKVLANLDDSIKRDVNRQVTRAFAFGVLVGLCIGLMF